MNILVTGGAGYIGSHACKELYRRGYNPIAYDNLIRGNTWAVRWGPLVHGSLSNQSLIVETIRKHEIQAVIHFAAYAYVGESMNHPHMYFENNMVNSLKLLQASQECGIKHFIFSSTCATYGNPQSLPITESHPQLPINPYGESKLLVEKLLRWYGDVHGLNSVCLRYFNAAGADEDSEIGECHNPETHLIPLVLRAAMNRSEPVHIFGNDFDTPDGTAIRDYIHVSDLASAHVQALQYLTNGGKSRAFNLGTGRGCSVAEIIKSVETVTGRKPAVIARPRRAGDPPKLVAHTALAASELGWTAKRIEIDGIVETAWRWCQNSVMEASRSRVAFA